MGESVTGRVAVGISVLVGIGVAVKRIVAVIRGARVFVGAGVSPITTVRTGGKLSPHALRAKSATSRLVAARTIRVVRSLSRLRVDAVSNYHTLPKSAHQ